LGCAKKLEQICSTGECVERGLRNIIERASFSAPLREQASASSAVQ
jgi:hypothetical protein